MNDWDACRRRGMTLRDAVDRMLPGLRGDDNSIERADMADVARAALAILEDAEAFKPDRDFVESENESLRAEVSRLKADRHEWKRQHAMMCRAYTALLEDRYQLHREASLKLMDRQSREDRLWAVADILHDILPYDNPEPLKQAIKARDLDALCDALGVEK